MGDIVVRWLQDGQLKSGGADDLATACASESWCWVDVGDPDAQTMEVLAERFGLHPLSVEDMLHPQQRAKLDLFDGELLLVWLTPTCDEKGIVGGSQVDFVLGEKYLITVHAGPLKESASEAEDGPGNFGRGPVWVMHGIIDRLVDDILPVVDRVGDDIEELEQRMLGNPRQTDLDQLYSIRRQLVHLHRIISPERDAIRALARRDIVSEDVYRYFMDIGDHLARVEDAIETYRDVGAAVMDIYLSAQNNRMNEIMKQLTVVATIFMPLTLISGIYGMNVIVGMYPPVTRFWSFWGIVFGMLAIAFTMMWYFRRKKWW